MAKFKVSPDAGIAGKTLVNVTATENNPNRENRALGSIVFTASDGTTKTVGVYQYGKGEFIKSSDSQIAATDTTATITVSSWYHGNYGAFTAESDYNVQISPLTDNTAEVTISGLPVNTTYEDVNYVVTLIQAGSNKELSWIITQAAVETLVLSTDTITLETGASTPLPTVYYNGEEVPYGDVTWILPPSIVSLDSGRIVGDAEGVGYLTASYNGMTASATVTVTAAAITYTFTITPTPNNATVIINGEEVRSVTVPQGTNITWRVFAEGYDEKTGSLKLNQTTTLPVTLDVHVVTYTFSVNASPSDAVVIINAQQRSSYTAEVGSTIVWSVSKEGYQTRSGIYILNQDYTETVSLPVQQYTLTIASTPADAVVTINGQVRTSITADVNSLINWSVAKTGYLTQSAEFRITENTNYNITLQAVPVVTHTLSINPVPADATVIINGAERQSYVGEENEVVTYSITKPGYVPTGDTTVTLSDDVYLTPTLVEDTVANITIDTANPRYVPIAYNTIPAVGGDNDIASNYYYPLIVTYTAGTTSTAYYVTDSNNNLPANCTTRFGLLNKDNNSISITGYGRISCNDCRHSAQEIGDDKCKIVNVTLTLTYTNPNNMNDTDYTLTNVAVYQYCSSYTVSTQSSGPVRIGDTINFIATLNGRNMTNNSDWSSSDSTILNINIDTGVAEALAVGDATITAQWYNLTATMQKSVVTVSAISTNHNDVRYAAYSYNSFNEEGETKLPNTFYIPLVVTFTNGTVDTSNYYITNSGNSNLPPQTAYEFTLSSSVTGISINSSTGAITVGENPTFNSRSLGIASIHITYPQSGSVNESTGAIVQQASAFSIYAPSVMNVGDIEWMAGYLNSRTVTSETTFSSSNPLIAEIYTSRITAKSSGNITVTGTYGSTTASQIVHVSSVVPATTRITDADENEYPYGMMLACKFANATYAAYTSGLQNAGLSVAAIPTEDSYNTAKFKLMSGSNNRTVNAAWSKANLAEESTLAANWDVPASGIPTQNVITVTSDAWGWGNADISAYYNGNNYICELETYHKIGIAAGVPCQPADVIQVSVGNTITVSLWREASSGAQLRQTIDADDIHEGNGLCFASITTVDGKTAFNITGVMAGTSVLYIRCKGVEIPIALQVV